MCPLEMRKPSAWVLSLWRGFLVDPNEVLTAHAGWLAGMPLRHFSPTYAVYKEDHKAGACLVVVYSSVTDC